MIILTRPQRKNVLNDAWVRWQSNRQPYIFSFQRVDTFCTLVNVSGFTRCNYSTSGLTDDSTIEVGNIVTIVTNGIARTGTITSFDSNIPTHNITTDIVWDATLGTSAILLWSKKETYKIRLTINAYIPSLGRTVLLGTLIGTPNSKGVCAIDCRTMLEYEMNKVNAFSFDTVNQVLNSGWLRFNIGYKDTYFEDGVLTTSTDVVEDTEIVNDADVVVDYWAIDGVKYLLEDYGQNYADYVTQLPTVNAKFLTSFDRPTYFVGYPFSLTYINNLPTYTQTIEADELDANGSTINHIDDNIIDVTQGLQQVVPFDTFEPLTESINVWLEVGGVAADGYVGDGYVDDGYVESTTAAPITPVRITEQKRVDINRDCRVNPIYLMWKNSIGGWDFWLFDKKTEIQVASKQNGSVLVETTDIATQAFREKLLSATQTKRYIVGDNVKDYSIKGLQGIESSPQVYMLVRSDLLTTEPARAWLGVTVAPKGFKYIKGVTNIDVELTFDLPDYYNVGN
jgi:hypothetical protein